MKWSCLVVDDEAIARKLISEYIEKIPELRLAATCATALEAAQYLRNEKIDILFLDIQMPDLTGIDFLNSIPVRPHTILTTAYSEYAVKSYELGVVDYLLKPIEFERFYKAVQKITGLSAQIQSDKKEEQKDRLFLKVDNKIVKVQLDQILVVNGKGAYIEVVLSTGKKLITLYSMSKLEEALPRNFYRTHRSHIINIS